ncbi:IS3 family transposase [Agrobacterium sp. DKPNP3]|uniref:IS3 family transposase n=1 Tax=Agrobacterium sp. DKPNP3 TaxID=3457323 RepID=UPI004043E5DE
MKALAHELRRSGYRRIHVLLRRPGHLVNHKKLFRLYREEKLTVRKRGGWKRAIGTPAPILVPKTATDRLSLDFVSDQLTMAAGSGCQRSSMIALENAWATPPIHRSRPYGWLVSWIGSSRGEVSRR